MSEERRRREIDEMGVWGLRIFPWWYHGLAWGWPTVEVTEHTKPMVGWKGEHPQSLVGYNL
jgi:hypothetical protein